MNNTTQNILIVLLSTIVIAVLGVFLYMLLATRHNPKFFPTELKQVRNDFNLVTIEPQGAPNPDYHPTYGDSK